MNTGFQQMILVNGFRGLLAPYLHDLDKLQLFPPFDRDAGYEQSLEALEKSKKLYGGLKMPGAQKRMRKRINRLEQAVNMLRAEYIKAEAEKVTKLKAQESQRHLNERTNPREKSQQRPHLLAFCSLQPGRARSN